MAMLLRSRNRVTAQYRESNSADKIMLLRSRNKLSAQISLFTIRFTSTVVVNAHSLHFFRELFFYRAVILFLLRGHYYFLCEVTLSLPRSGFISTVQSLCFYCSITLFLLGSHLSILSLQSLCFFHSIALFLLCSHFVSILQLPYCFVCAIAVFTVQ